MCDAVVGQFVLDRADQSCLAIGPSGAFYARAHGNTTLFAVATHQQFGTERFARGQCDLNAGCRDLLVNNRILIDLSDPVRLRQSRLKGAIEEAVFAHKAHRAFFDLVVIKMQKERRGAFARAPVADFDIKHGLCIRRDAVPNTDGIQQAF